MFAIGTSQTALAVRYPRGGAAVRATITAVAANGWTATMPVPADLALSPVAVTRQGFTSAGAATTIAETLYTTKRTAVPWFSGMDVANPPLTANDVALSDFMYAGDVISGVTNSSTLDSPKPVAVWGLPHSELVGNTITQEVIAFHRNGVACVELRATDGTTTVAQIVAAPTVSPRTGDKNAVIAYRFALDVSTLADEAQITVNAKVYPRIGVAASVRDSAATVTSWGFGPRIYRRSTARAAAPFYIYVDPVGGVDAVNANSVSNAADDTAARAARVATIQYANLRLAAVRGTAAGACDGAEIRLYEGTHTNSSAGAYTAPTLNAAIVIKPAAGAAKPNTIYSFGTNTSYLNAAHVRCEGIVVRRGGASFYTNGAGWTLTLNDCIFEPNGNTATPIFGGAGSGFLLVDTTVTQQPGNTLGGTANQEMRLLRGCDIQSPAEAGIELMAAVGCVFGRMNNSLGGNHDQSGNVVAFNRFLRCNPTSAGVTLGINTGSGGLIDGIAVVQNVFETISASGSTSVRALALSGDDATVNTRHALIWHNTFTGYQVVGRNNLLYDETIGTLRTHTLHSLIGNLHSQINTKHDAFMGTKAPAEAANHVGGWSMLYGVGARGEFSRYVTSTPETFARRYAGQGSLIAAGDPLFSNYQAGTAVNAIQPGGGDYTLQGASPARDIVTNSPLPFGLSGAARGGTSAAGAYA